MEIWHLSFFKLEKDLKPVGRLLRPDIVHFHFTHLGTEIFLRELTLSNTLSLNPKSSRSIDLEFSHKLQFHDNVFIVQRHGSMTTNDYVTRKFLFLLTNLPFNKRPVFLESF